MMRQKHVADALLSKR